MRNFVPLLLAFASTAAFAAGAEDAGSVPVNPPEFEPYALAQVTVTANAPQATQTSVETSVTAEQIEAAGAKTVAEALRIAPGVRMSIGRKNEPDISIHGFNQGRLLVLIDGVPYYETNYGKLDLNQIPTDNIARIDVIKTAASVLYGANALGGAINIVTRTAGDKPYAAVRLETGEEATSRASATYGARKGSWNFWFNAGKEKSDGYKLSRNFTPIVGMIQQKNPTRNIPAVLEDGDVRDNSDYDRTDLWAKVGYKPSDRSELFVNVHYLDQEKGMPVAMDVAQVMLAKPAFSHFARAPKYRDYGIDLDGRQRVGAGWTLTEKVFYHDHLDDYASYSDQALTNEISVSEYKDFIAGFSLAAEKKLGDWSLRGAAHYREDSHSERDDAYLPFAKSVSRTGTVGVEAEWRATDKLTVVAGLGEDWFGVRDAWQNVTDRNTGAFIRQDPRATPSTNAFGGTLTAQYSLGEGQRLFVAAAKKSRFPTLQQLYSSKGGNTDLDPEKSFNLSFGYGRTFAENGRFEASLFRYAVKDMISRDGSNVLNTYQNYGEAHMTGFETLIEGDVAAPLHLAFTYTYNHAIDVDDNRVTDDVINVPAHSATLDLAWRLPWRRAHLDVGGLYMGEVFTALPTPHYPTDPAKKIGGYMLWNARVGVDLGRGAEVYVEARNLFDRDYLYDYMYPAAGRMFFGGLVVKL